MLKYMLSQNRSLLFMQAPLLDRNRTSVQAFSLDARATGIHATKKPIHPLLQLQ